jgi:hypothetical protein
MHPRFYSILALLLIAGLAVEFVQIEVDKSRLRRQIAPLSQNGANLTRLRTESARHRAILAQFKTGSDAGARAIHADLVAARAELAALETKASRFRADASATPSIEANRDPTKAMTRAEFMSDVGRTTPEAAFQTLIWATMKGRDPEMAACIALDGAARAKTESFLATLSAEARAKYSAPEQLVALSFAYGTLESTAFQFATSTLADDGAHATLAVRIRANGRESETKIPMVGSADGWAIAVSEKQIDGLLAGLTADLPKR